MRGGEAEAGAHQVDHGPVVAGREVDAGSVNRALAHLDRLAATAQASRDSRLPGPWAGACPPLGVLPPVPTAPADGLQALSARTYRTSGTGTPSTS
jgi:hypothetical protein